MGFYDVRNHNNGSNNGGIGHITNPSGPNPSGANVQFSSQSPLGTPTPDGLIDYNAEFKNEAPILYRDSVIKQAIATLLNKNKPNPVLIGAAGVGKTNIVEELARMLANDHVLIPDNLKGYTIYEMPITGLTAGTSFRGAMEEKIKNLIEFASDPDNKAIIFIDEIHTVMGYDEISQALKPAMARGNIKLITATTLQEANKLMEDPAFNRRTQRIIVDELNVAQTSDILKSVYNNRLNAHHNKEVVVRDDLFETIVHIADRNKTGGSHRPDNAITLLDNAMSSLRLNKLVEIQKAFDNNDMDTATFLQQTPTQLMTAQFLEECAEKLRSGNSQTDSSDHSMEDALSRIKGQDHIVSEVVDLSRRMKMNIFTPKKPKSLMFVGPSGVGKTEISKIISRHATGLDPIIINMQEYTSPGSINNIIGSPIGYVGSTSKHELPFDTLQTNPRRVVVLDEFEKGHESVQRLFMGALDEGYFTTNRGNRIDFSQAIIIATTNAGQTNQKEARVGFGRQEDGSTSIDLESLKAHFATELLNRFTHRLQFRSLNVAEYKEIIESKYQTMRSDVLDRFHMYTLPETIEQETMDKWLNEYQPELGARPIEHMLETYIEDALISKY